MKKSLVIIMFFFGGVLFAQVPPGAVAYWPLDGNANDLSGNGSNGTVTAAVPAPNRFGTPNKAYRFNGTNSRIDIANNTFVDIAPNSDFSISYWQKCYTNSNATAIITKHLSGFWNGYNFIGGNTTNGGYCTTPGHMYWYVAAGFQQDACSNDAVLTDTLWRCVTGVYVSATNESLLYINGIQQVDVGGASGTISNNSNLNFGYEDDNGGSGYFNGVLDQIRIYKKALTVAEVQQLCNETECVAPSAPSNASNISALKICFGSSAVLKATGSGTLTWYSTPNATTSLATGSVLTVAGQQVGVYNYYVAATTCTNGPRTAITVTVSECTGIEEIKGAESLYQIYPNPNNGKFVVRSDEFSASTEAVLINQLGSEVYRQKISSSEIILQTDLLQGLYFIEIRDSGKVLATKKIIIER
jgi:hypothetical protein